MRAYQCDRCGRFYTYASKNINTIFVTSSCTSTGCVQDLCSECQKELEAWWTEKKGQAVKDADNN